MIIRDEQQRIMNVSPDECINTGHSVCMTCGKDMPRCWNVICAVCGNASCYDCATAKSGFWFCKTCFDNYPQNLETAKANVLKMR